MTKKQVEKMIIDPKKLYDLICKEYQKKDPGIWTNNVVAAEVKIEQELPENDFDCQFLKNVETKTIEVNQYTLNLKGLLSKHGYESYILRIDVQELSRMICSQNICEKTIIQMEGVNFLDDGINLVGEDNAMSAGVRWALGCGVFRRENFNVLFRNSYQSLSGCDEKLLLIAFLEKLKFANSGDGSCKQECDFLRAVAKREFPEVERLLLDNKFRINKFCFIMSMLSNNERIMLYASLKTASIYKETLFKVYPDVDEPRYSVEVELNTIKVILTCTIDSISSSEQSYFSESYVAFVKMLRFELSDIRDIYAYAKDSLNFEPELLGIKKILGGLCNKDQLENCLLLADLLFRNQLFKQHRPLIVLLKLEIIFAMGRDNLLAKELREKNVSEELKHLFNSMTQVRRNNNKQDISNSEVGNSFLSVKPIYFEIICRRLSVRELTSIARALRFLCNQNRFKQKQKQKEKAKSLLVGFYNHTKHATFAYFIAEISEDYFSSKRWLYIAMRQGGKLAIEKFSHYLLRLMERLSESTESRYQEIVALTQEGKVFKDARETYLFYRYNVMVSLYQKSISMCDDDKHNNMAQAKAILNELVMSNFKPAKVIAKEYNSEIIEDIKSNNLETMRSGKKRKYELLANSFGERKILPCENVLPIVPEFRLSDCSLLYPSKSPHKAVEVSDKTLCLNTDRHEEFDGYREDKENYLFANLTLIFSDRNDLNHTRLERMIGIGLDDAGVVTNNERIHESLVGSANSVESYRKIKQKELELEKLGLHTPASPSMAKGKSIATTYEQDKSFSSHTEQALVTYLRENAEKLFERFKFKHKDVFESGCKVYAVILDIYSKYPACFSCHDTLMALPYMRNEFFKIFEQTLIEKGCRLRTKAVPGSNDCHLHAAIRYRAKRKDGYVIPKNIKGSNIKNRIGFFAIVESKASDFIATDDNHVIFKSGNW